VDTLGGMREAIDIAKDLAGIPRTRLTRVRVLPKRGLLDKLLSAGLGAAARVGGGLTTNSLSGIVDRLGDDRHFAWERISIQD